MTSAPALAVLIGNGQVVLAPGVPDAPADD
jgi:hypothetical protein